MFRKFPRSCNIALSFNIREHPCNDASPDDCTSLSLTLSIKILILSWGVVAFHTIRIMARRYGSALCNESLVELHCHGKRSLFCRSALWNILEATSITVSPLRKLMLIRINLNKNCSCFIFRMASFVILGYRIEISLATFNFCFFVFFFFCWIGGRISCISRMYLLFRCRIYTYELFSSLSTFHSSNHSPLVLLWLELVYLTTCLVCVVQCACNMSTLFLQTFRILFSNGITGDQEWAA